MTSFEHYGGDILANREKKFFRFLDVGNCDARIKINIVGAFVQFAIHECS